MGRRTLLAILTLFTPGAVAHAQAVGRIVGRVVAAEGPGLPGISVTVLGTTRVVVSDTGGRFTIVDVPVGQRIVRAARVGYAPDSQVVTVASGQTANVTLQLTVRAVQLEGVVTIGYGSTNRREITGAV